MAWYAWIRAGVVLAVAASICAGGIAPRLQNRLRGRREKDHANSGVDR